MHSSGLVPNPRKLGLSSIEKSLEESIMNWILRYIRGLLGIKAFGLDAAKQHATERRARNEQARKELEAAGVKPELIKLLLDNNIRDIISALKQTGIEITIEEDIKAVNADIDTEVAERNGTITGMKTALEAKKVWTAEEIKKLQDALATMVTETDTQVTEETEAIADLEEERNDTNTYNEYIV